MNPESIIVITKVLLKVSTSFQIKRNVQHSKNLQWISLSLFDKVRNIFTYNSIDTRLDDLSCPNTSVLKAVDTIGNYSK